ncbi:LAMI_0E13014g1_1 [Lachancea mirantina]|uniref:Tryptophan--tRNA ligase, mitochondrial n=1 Tax=Lachancea mirantina TaxID=1230905 RepID=A0A1G4JQF8_9SACH|nr:LAMI_0E13014g1_1 [Lachancea mirantina]
MFRLVSIRNASRRLYSARVKTTDFKITAQDVPDDSVVFSMIQPTGRFHLGNYLGAVRVWKDLCDLKGDNIKLLFGVADLHAITVPKPDGSKFRQLRNEAIASILAVGVDPSKAIVFHQSSVPQHTELHWILSTLTPMGYLNRMTQWKSKANVNDNSSDEAMQAVKLGLFSYPVLQAADILLYNATHVPVGDDQAQHLELTRHIAGQFNKTYKCKHFVPPATLLAPTKRILALNNPDKKMSKSDPNQNSVIYLNDTPKIISAKIKQALTDSISHKFYFDPVNRPGVSNLINILSGILRLSISEVEDEISKFDSHSSFKDYVSEILIEELKTPRHKFEKLMRDQAYLQEVSEKSARSAATIAEPNIQKIKNIMGF